MTLTPTANFAQTFMGWSGHCVGTGPCTVTMNAARNVTATFEPTRMLTISKVGDGVGRVRSSPQGIDCGTDCSENYTGTSITSVTLTASLVTGEAFSASTTITLGDTSYCKI